MQDFATFYPYPREDTTNNTLVVPEVAADVVYSCTAIIPDLNGEDHTIRSNNVIVAKIGGLLSLVLIIIQTLQQWSHDTHAMVFC